MGVIGFHEDIQPSIGGGKAASLSLMQKYGVNVPAGFVLDKDVLNAFRLAGQLSSKQVELIKVALQHLNAKKVIVRSSAVGEDSDSHSFAGQLDSIVVQNNLEDVIEATKDCWRGLDNDRLKAYEQLSGKRLTEMAVVVQEFIAADYAGVSFTQSPYQADQMYTEYVEGAGEQLVSGKVTPHQLSVKLVDKTLAVPFKSDELMAGLRVLVDAYKAELDVEWVIQDDKVYFVQARPITVKQKQKVHWSSTNLNENYPDSISPLLYSIARDSYYHYFKNLAKLVGIGDKQIRHLEYDFSNAVGIWGNRLYYNMTSIHNILSASALRSYFKSAFNQFVGYSNEDVANDTSAKRTSLIKVVYKLIHLNFSLNKNVRTIEKKVSDFTVQVRNSKDVFELKDAYYQFLDLRFNQWYHASLADMFAMIHYKALGVFTQRFYGVKSVGVHNTLIQAIPGLISSEPLNDIYDIVQLINVQPDCKNLFITSSAEDVWIALDKHDQFTGVKQNIHSYLQEWGFRCSGELMFFKQNYIQNPTAFIALVQGYMKNNVKDPRLVIAQRGNERRKLRRAFAWKIIKKRHILVPVSLVEVGLLYLSTYLCKNGIASRERVRYKQAEMYFRMKEIVLAIGGKMVKEKGLSSPEDLFYLSYKEIGELLSASMMDEQGMFKLILDRKAAFKKESEDVYPQDFSTEFGIRPEKVPISVTSFESLQLFSGLAASGGKVKGKVKVLESVLEGEKLDEGDILITRQTDPGWAMVFPIIGGLIVEKGGALSHGAIVAREFGIPAVIGIPGIVEQFKDGDEVLLDGDLGEIHRL